MSCLWLEALADLKLKRETFFITSKIPGGAPCVHKKNDRKNRTKQS